MDDIIVVLYLTLLVHLVILVGIGLIANLLIDIKEILERRTNDSD